LATYIQHDGFARQSLKRETLANSGGSQSCSWCGQHPKRLYRYGTEEDDGRFNGYAKGQFCNVDCFESYHH